MFKPINIGRSKKFGSNYWEVFSIKAKRIACFYSNLEYNHYILVETDPNIIEFCEQPQKIKYILDGQEIETIMDMWLKYIDGTESFVEVKYASDIDPENIESDRLIRQINAQKTWCNDNGYNYRLFTDEIIKNNPLFFSNMKLILSYVKRIENPVGFNGFQIEKLITNLRLSIADIYSYLNDISIEEIKEHIAWMIYKGKVLSNIETIEFGLKTEVWLCPIIA